MILEHFGDIWSKHPRSTIGRYWRARIDRYTRHGVDRQRSVQEARLVTADLKPKNSLFYKIAPDEFYPNYISSAAMLEAESAFFVFQCFTDR